MPNSLRIVPKNHSRTLGCKGCWKGETALHKAEQKAVIDRQDENKVFELKFTQY